MSYIGKEPQFTQYPSKFFNGDGTAMTVTLDYSPPNAAALLVFIDGVRQDTSAYTLSGTSLTFTGTVPSGTNNVQVVHLGLTQDVGVPSDDTISTAKIQDDAVTSAKLANSLNITSGNSLIIDSGATITNNGTATGFTNVFDVYFQGELASNQTIARATNVKVTGMTSNKIDSDSAFDGTTFTVPSGKGGLYIIFVHTFFDFSAVGEDGMDAIAMIYVNGAEVFRGTHLGTASGPDTFEKTNISLSLIKNLSAGDTVELYVQADEYNAASNPRVNSRDTSLGGFRLS